nr:pollen receptor-like kinase 1 [Tanacetum cinerariifolium]
MMLLGSMSHPNLLPYVACNYDEDGLLITDFAVNGSMASHLHEHELATWVNSIGREEWTSKVFDNCMKWAKNNEIEMIDLMGIELRCCESDVSRRWDMRKGTTEQELVTWVNSIGREEWTNKVFDNCMKWAKNNEIEMIDLMGIGLRCCESDVSRRWDMRKVFEKIQGLRETKN